MTVLKIILLVFSVLGAIDYTFGSRFGFGKEFVRAFHMFASLSLAMMGMIVLAPLIADFMRPMTAFCADVLHLDPSILPASLLANDMGGAPLAEAVMQNKEVGLFNAYVVSAMMGCTISFTIPLALGSVPKEKHTLLLLGLLAGIATIPLGAFAAGIVAGVPLSVLCIDLLPLLLLAVLICASLLLFPHACIKVFAVLGYLIKIIVLIGLVLGLIRYFTDVAPIEALNLAPIEEGGMIAFRAIVMASGALPLLYAVSVLVKRPLRAVGNKLGVNEASVAMLLGSLASTPITFASTDRMNAKGITLNAAFAVSAGFLLAGHLAFTISMAPSYVLPLAVGKLTAGVSAAFLALFLYKRNEKNLLRAPS